MAGRPALKVFAKRKAGGVGPEYVDIAAFWRNENGMLSGKLDSKVTGIVVEYADGTRAVIAPGTHFLNCREENARPAARAQPSRKPADGGDDIPFDFAAAGW